MEYQKIIIFSDNTPNQPSKFKTKIWVEINDETRETYNEDNQVRFKTLILRSSLYDYSDAYILIKETITVAEAATSALKNADKKVIFRNCAPFTNCLSKINNKEGDDGHDIAVVMPVYNLIEYIDSYLKTSGIFWQYCADQPTLTANGNIANFNTDNASTDSFKIKEKITDQTGINGTKNVEIMVPLKYLANFWKTLEMPLINYEINFDLNLSKNSVIVANNADKAQHFQ